MRLRRTAIILACLGLSALSGAQTNPVARQLLKNAEEKCAQIRDKDDRAYRQADIAEAWQAIDKKSALADLNLAAQSLSSSPDSPAWRAILRVWTHQNPNVAFQTALDLRSSPTTSQRIGEVIAMIAPQDMNKALADLAKAPAAQRQEVAEDAVRELAYDNEGFCEPFIQGATGVKIDALYNIVARFAEDPQLSIKAAHLAGADKSSAMTEAVRKNSETNPTLAHGLIAEVSDPNDRALALAYCAEAFNLSNPDNAAQCATESITLYKQSSPEWLSRARLFEKLEPHLSGIDTPEVRDFILRFTDGVDNHFNDASDSELAAQPSWLIECAAAWSRLSLETARKYAGRALEINPSAGVHSGDGGGDFISYEYRRFLDELAKQDPEDAANQLIAIKGDWPHVYPDAAKSILDDLEPQYKDQARTMAKQLHGDFPNVAETEMDYDLMTPDAAADGLLRVESDSYTPYEFSDYANHFVETLVQSDPYRAVRVIINLESAARRVPLLSHVIVAIAKSNSTLAQSTYEKASQDLAKPMSTEDQVTANTELAKAAIALGR